MGGMERSLGDLTDRQIVELTAVGRKAEQLHGTLAEERAARERHQVSVRELVTKERGERDRVHASMRRRVECLEFTLGEHGDRHSKELSEVKALTDKLMSDSRSAQQGRQHGSLAERLECLEKHTGESVKRLSAELLTTHSKIDQLYTRLTVVKDAWVTESPHSASTGSPSHQAFGSPASGSLGRPHRIV